MNEINQLVLMSKYSGERFDLVQAGGGNSSVKIDEKMYIKASGFLLSDLELNKGYSCVDTNKVAKIVSNKELLSIKNKREREVFTSSLMKEATIDENNRPSIETLLHSLLNKYTLHTHPLVVNVIVVKKNYEVILRKLFDGCMIVDYNTPGIELAISLNNQLNDHIKVYGEKPKITFLQNHGLIISSDNYDEIKSLTEMVLEKIENYVNIDMTKYKLVTKVSELLKRVDSDFNKITYLSEDKILNELSTKEILQEPFCPDKLVFCGVSGVELKTIDDKSSIENYQNKYYELPKIIIFKGNIFCISDNVKKAKEVEEVLKFHSLVIRYSKEDINYLEEDELSYLANWEAEKYRQKL